MLPKYKSVKNCPKCGRSRDVSTCERRYPDMETVLVWCHGCGARWCEDTRMDTPPVNPCERREAKSVRVKRSKPITDGVRKGGIELTTDRCNSLDVWPCAVVELNVRPGVTGILTWTPDPKPEPVFCQAVRERGYFWACSRCGGRQGGVMRKEEACCCCGTTFNADPKYLDA